MTTKLTLSVPADAVEKAKSYAKRHGTSVSALFTAAIEALPDDSLGVRRALADWPELEEFIGMTDRAQPFDERSRRILEKHG